MFARSGRLALALVLAVPVASVAGAQGFQYAASTGQYRVSTKTKGAQEAMGQKQEFEQSADELITVTVARQSKDTLAMTVVIDSVNMVGPMGMTPPGLDKMRGTRIAAKLAPHGVVYSAEGPSPESIPQATQMTDEASRFLPRIRIALAMGATWTDTATGKVKQGGVDIDRRSIATYKVVGDTTIAGEKTWKIARTSVTTLTGSGTNQGQPITMEGTSNGSATVFVSQKGVYVGSQNEEQANVKIVFASNGMEVGVTTTANTSIQKVK